MHTATGLKKKFRERERRSRQPTKENDKKEGRKEGRTVAADPEVVSRLSAKTNRRVRNREEK